MLLHIFGISPNDKGYHKRDKIETKKRYLYCTDGVFLRDTKDGSLSPFALQIRDSANAKRPILTDGLLL